MLRGKFARWREPDRLELPFGAVALTTHDPNSGCGIPLNPREGEILLTEAGLHSDPLATLGAPARDDRATALGLHARTEAVRLRAVTPVGLECALRHERYLLLIR